MADSLENYYKLCKWYSITLNPIDKYQYFNSPNRFKRFKSFIYEQLLTFPAKYELFIEISEPHGMHTQGYSGPRLHLHGKIQFNTNKDRYMFLSNGYYKLLRFCSVDIDTIDDLRKWYKYCTKQHIFKLNRLASYEV